MSVVVNGMYIHTYTFLKYVLDRPDDMYSPVEVWNVIVSISARFCREYQHTGLAVVCGKATMPVTRAQTNKQCD